MIITVENIKCGGCAGTITKKLNSTFAPKSLDIDVENGVIEIDVNDEKRAEVVDLLLSIGYPEVNSVQGINSVKAKAKSFVSCAIGRMDK